MFTMSRFPLLTVALGLSITAVALSDTPSSVVDSELAASLRESPSRFRVIDLYFELLQPRAGVSPGDLGIREWDEYSQSLRSRMDELKESGSIKGYTGGAGFFQLNANKKAVDALASWKDSRENGVRITRIGIDTTAKAQAAKDSKRKDTESPPNSRRKPAPPRQVER